MFSLFALLTSKGLSEIDFNFRTSSSSADDLPEQASRFGTILLVLSF